MRARDFITERQRSWGIGDVNLIFDEPGAGEPPEKKYHLRDRQIERGVSDQERDAILKQLPMVRRPMLEFTRGQEFWLYDPKLNKAVGLRVMDHKNKIYKVATVFGRLPADSDKVLHVPGVDPASLQEGLDSYRLERLDPQTRRALLRMADHSEPGSWLSASEAYAMQLGLQYKNRDPRGWEQGVQHLVDLYKQHSTVLEGWRDTVAGLAMSGLAMTAGAHTVKPGDTVYSIARANNTTPAEIARANNLGPNFNIEVGQKLRIPGSTRAAATKPAATPSARPVAKPATPPLAKAQPMATDQLPLETRNPHMIRIMQAAKDSGISKRDEVAALLAQTAHESTNYTRMIEDLSYSPEGILRTFGNIVRDRKAANRYAYRPQALANHVYANKNGNGNEASGDGWRYRGRGYIQITGRGMYRAAGEALGLPLEQKPDLAARPDVAARVAVWYWRTYTRSKVKDFYDVRKVTGTINKARLGLSDREQKFIDYYQLMHSQAQRRK